MMSCTEVVGLTEALYIHNACMTCGMGKKEEKTEKLDNGQILLTMTDRRQTRSLVRDGVPQTQDRKFQTELISGRMPHSGLDTNTY
jgi:hypothetical protein